MEDGRNLGPPGALLAALLALGALACGAGAPPQQEVEVSIESPRDGAEVEHGQLVSGKVSDRQAQVYVLVHPLTSSTWWVQRPASPPNRDGAWRTFCYFGTETQGDGELFELVALVSRDDLTEGATLTDLPPALGRSDVLTVRRAE